MVSILCTNVEMVSANDHRIQRGNNAQCTKVIRLQVILALNVLSHVNCIVINRRLYKQVLSAVTHSYV